MTKQIDSLNSSESGDLSSKLTKQKNNWKDKIKNIITSWIAAGSMWWIAPAPAHTAPVSNKNTITCIEPSSTDIKTIWPRTTAKLFATFKEWSNKIPKIDTPTNNNTEATLDVNQYETDITKWEDWTTAETEANNSTINSLEYKALEIENINPEDLMPKVEVWDKDVYKHIEHLRIPESTVITDMMWKYGAGNYSPEEYQQLMMRLNTGMLWENPVDYDNYEAVWWMPWDEPSNHAHAERFTLNTLIKHANFKVINNRDIRNDLYTLCCWDSNKINIMWLSTWADANKDWYDSRNNERNKQYDKEKNRLVFCAWWNIRTEGGNLHNKVYQEDIPLPDQHSVYGPRSRAHSKNDNTLDRHLLITFGTNKDGDIDQTNENGESSKFPVWFHDKVLFSWHTFPYRKNFNDKIRAPFWKYATSFTNYLNVAIADLCFQMKADVSDVDELLEMIRSTALTDYIRFDLNGDGDTDDTYQGQPETQPLQLMNPAWFFKEYLMPTSLPTNLKSNETTPLEKWYYHGVVYQIPGAEVNINGQWVPFTDDNKELIFSQNPMNLEWRLNGETLNNYNYKPGDTISGQIIAVDDQWNGLNIAKDFSINMEDASGIDSVTMSHVPNTWYTIDGIRLNEKPTKPGIYIVNGQKVIVK